MTLRWPKPNRLPWLGTVLFLGLGLGVWFLSPLGEHKTDEVISVVGGEQTEGEATAWNNAQKLAVDGQGGVHIVYQYDYGRDDPDVIRYSYSNDGREWKYEEWPGRYPTVAVDARDRVYLAYVERTSQGDRLWLRRRIPDGSWVSRELARSEPRALFYPALAVGPQALHLVWEAHTSAGHSIRYVAFPLDETFTRASYGVETLVANREGVYFPTLEVDGRGHVVVAWEAARDPVSHRIDAATRTADGWKHHRDISESAKDARHPALGLGATGRVQVVYVVREGSSRSGLYVTALDETGLSWDPPGRLTRQGREGDTTLNGQRIIAFPAIEGGYVLWGHTVPAACGTGPLFWVRQDETGSWSAPRELMGDFAAYPHLIERPGGVVHLVWTDREVQALRSFEVRYARLHLPQD